MQPLARDNIDNDKFLSQFCIPIEEIKGNGPVFKQNKENSTKRAEILNRAQAGGEYTDDRELEMKLKFDMRKSYQKTPWPKPSANSSLSPEELFINPRAGRADLNYAFERYGTKRDANPRKPPPYAGAWRLKERKAFEGTDVPNFSASTYERYMKLFEPKISSIDIPPVHSVRNSENVLNTKTMKATKARASSFASVLASGDDRSTSTRFTQLSTLDSDPKVKRVTFDLSNTKKARRVTSLRGGTDFQTTSAASALEVAEKASTAAIKANDELTIMDGNKPSENTLEQKPRSEDTEHNKCGKPMEILAYYNSSENQATAVKVVMAAPQQTKKKQIKRSSETPQKKPNKISNTILVNLPGYLKRDRDAKATAKEMIAKILNEGMENKAPKRNVQKTAPISLRTAANAQKIRPSTKTPVSKKKNAATSPNARVWKTIGRSADIPQIISKPSPKRAKAGKCAQPVVPHTQQYATTSVHKPHKSLKTLTGAVQNKVLKKPMIPEQRKKPNPPSTKVAPARIMHCDFEILGNVDHPGFRHAAQRYALSQNLCGWIMLTPRCTIKGMLEGREDDINRMKIWLSEKGTATSIIDAANFSDLVRVSKYTNTGFLIKPSRLLDERVELDEPWLWLDPKRKNINNKKEIKKK